MIDALQEQARGHWHHILTRLGVDAKFLATNKPCPVCGGSDRFSYTDLEGKGTYYCRGCGHGDGLDLLVKLHGWDFKTAAREVEKVLGTVQTQPKRERKKADPTKALNAAYKGSQPVFAGCLVHQYLKARGLSVLPPSLRYHPNLELGRQSFPAMLAVLSDASGQFVSIHRTYLEGNQKAPIENPKMLMTPKGTVNGSAVRLWPATDTVGLSEGVETAAACFELYGVPTWSCISSGGLERVVLPGSIKHVFIFADNDADKFYEGQRAAYAVASRLAKEGKRVEVKIAPLPGTDFLDELNLQRRSRR